MAYDNCTLYNMQGQDIGSMGLVRDPKTTDMEDYEECNDDSQKLLLSNAKRGRELYIYPENFVVVGNMKAEVRVSLIDPFFARFLRRLTISTPDRSALEC